MSRGIRIELNPQQRRCNTLCTTTQIQAPLSIESKARTGLVISVRQSLSTTQMTRAAWRALLSALTTDTQIPGTVSNLIHPSNPKTSHTHSLAQHTQHTQHTHLHGCLQCCDGCWVVEVLLSLWVGPEVVVAGVRHCMRLSSGVGKRGALLSVCVWSVCVEGGRRRQMVLWETTKHQKEN